MTKFTPFNVRWQFSNSEAKLSNEIIPCRHGWCLHSWNTYPEKSLERFTDSWLHLGTLVLWIGGSAFSLHFKRYNQLDLIGIAGPYSLYPQYHMQWQFGIWLYLLYVFSWTYISKCCYHFWWYLLWIHEYPYRSLPMINFHKKTEINCDEEHIKQCITSSSSPRRLYKAMEKYMPSKDFIREEQEMLPGGDIRIKGNAWLRKAWSKSGGNRVPREAEFRRLVGFLMTQHNLCSLAQNKMS